MVRVVVAHYEGFGGADGAVVTDAEGPIFNWLDEGAPDASRLVGWYVEEGV